MNWRRVSPPFCFPCMHAHCSIFPPCYRFTFIARATHSIAFRLERLPPRTALSRSYMHISADIRARSHLALSRPTSLLLIPTKIPPHSAQTAAYTPILICNSMVHHTGIWCFLSDSIIFHRSDGANGLRHHQPEGCGPAAYTPPTGYTHVSSVYIPCLPAVAYSLHWQGSSGRRDVLDLSTGGTSSICLQEGHPRSVYKRDVLDLSAGGTSSICLQEGRARSVYRRDVLDLSTGGTSSI